MGLHCRKINRGRKANQSHTHTHFTRLTSFPKKSKKSHPMLEENKVENNRLSEDREREKRKSREGRKKRRERKGWF